MIATSQSEYLFLHLLQASLWEKELEVSRFYNITTDVWKEISDLSIRHGVHSIVFDAISRLSPDFYPSPEMKLHWAIRAKQTEKLNEYKYKVVAELSRYYRENGVKMMLLKGICLAACYPIPIHRESGDIDVWLFGNKKKGDDLMNDLGEKIHNYGLKHSCSYFKGIPVENHDTFLNVNRFKIDKYIENTLYEILEEEGCETLVVDNENILYPTPTFDIIFNARHIMTHVPRGIVMRHLCDWAMLLYTNQGRYDVEKFEHTFRIPGGHHIVSALTRLAIEYIGLPQSTVPFDISIDTKLEDQLFAEVLRSPGKLKNPHANAIRKFEWNFKRFQNEQWKYKLIYNETLPNRICKSIRWFYMNEKNPFH